ncbi:MAG: hypothetical protein MHPSP_003643, partial [Paramarteilia canceri]
LLIRIKEDANFCARQCCKASRATTVNFMIPDSKIVFMTLKRDCICQCVLCCCVSGNKMHLYKPEQTEKDKPFCTITQ